MFRRILSSVYPLNPKCKPKLNAIGVPRGLFSNSNRFFNTVHPAEQRSSMHSVNALPLVLSVSIPPTVYLDYLTKKRQSQIKNVYQLIAELQDLGSEQASLSMFMKKLSHQRLCAMIKSSDDLVFVMDQLQDYDHVMPMLLHKLGVEYLKSLQLDDDQAKRVFQLLPEEDRYAWQSADFQPKALRR